MTQDAQLSRFEALPEQVQDDLHLIMYWCEHYGTQAEANAVERLTDYFAQDAEAAESAQLAALRAVVIVLTRERDELTRGIEWRNNIIQKTGKEVDRLRAEVATLRTKVAELQAILSEGRAATEEREGRSVDHE